MKVLCLLILFFSCPASFASDSDPNLPCNIKKIISSESSGPKRFRINQGDPTFDKFYAVWECQNCGSYASANPSLSGVVAKNGHASSFREEKRCISCGTPKQKGDQWLAVAPEYNPLPQGHHLHGKPLTAQQFDEYLSKTEQNAVIRRQGLDLANRLDRLAAEQEDDVWSCVYCSAINPGAYLKTKERCGNCLSCGAARDEGEMTNFGSESPRRPESSSSSLSSPSRSHERRIVPVEVDIVEDETQMPAVSRSRITVGWEVITLSGIGLGGLSLGGVMLASYLETDVYGTVTSIETTPDGGKLVTVSFSIEGLQQSFKFFPSKETLESFSVGTNVIVDLDGKNQGMSGKKVQ